MLYTYISVNQTCGTLCHTSERHVIQLQGPPGRDGRDGIPGRNGVGFHGRDGRKGEKGETAGIIYSY